jgi:hypothetical protein
MAQWPIFIGKAVIVALLFFLSQPDATQGVMNLQAAPAYDHAGPRLLISVTAAVAASSRARAESAPMLHQAAAGTMHSPPCRYVHAYGSRSQQLISLVQLP